MKIGDKYTSLIRWDDREVKRTGKVIQANEYIFTVQFQHYRESFHQEVCHV